MSPFFHDIKTHSFSQNKCVFSKKHFCHIHIFFIQVKYISFITCFSLNAFLVSISGLLLVFIKARILLSVCK